MVDSRQKGARAEAAIVKKLKEDTGLNWKRTPGSGALHEDHLMKGDCYIPGEHNYWATEVKHYKECHLSSNVLTDKSPTLLEWWKQSERQGEQTSKKPLLFFKHDRSKWFVGMKLEDLPLDVLDRRCIIIGPEGLVIFTYDIWCSDVLPYIEWIK